MAKNRQKSDAYSKCYEYGHWDDPETGETDWVGFFAGFEAEMAAAPLEPANEGSESKMKVMRRYGIWFGPQR